MKTNEILTEAARLSETQYIIRYNKTGQFVADPAYWSEHGTLSNLKHVFKFDSQDEARKWLHASLTGEIALQLKLGVPNMEPDQFQVVKCVVVYLVME